MADHLTRHDGIGLSPQAEITGPVDLTPGQIRWLADHPNLDGLVRLAWLAVLEPGPVAPPSEPSSAAATAPADRHRPASDHSVVSFRQGLAAVLRQHDALRARLADGFQEIASVAETPLPVLHLTVCSSPPDENTLIAAAAELTATLDPRQGRLLAGHLWWLPDGDRLLVAVHGFAADPIAFGQVVADIGTASRQAAAGRPVDLGPKMASLRAWTQELARFLASPVLGDQLAFWLDQAEAVRQSQLPLAVAVALDPAPAPAPEAGPAADRASVSSPEAGSATSQLSAGLTASLDPGLTTRLLTEALPAYGTTVQDLVVAAAVWAAHEVFGLDALAVEVEGDGRHLPGDPLDLSRTVGWLSCPYPLVVPARPVVSAAIVAAKEAIRAVPAGGLGYALLRPLSIPGLDVRPNLAVRFDPGPDPVALGPDLIPMDWPTGPVAPPSAPVTLTAAVKGSRLELVLAFPPDRLSQADAWRLMVALQDGLTSIIEHCAAQPTALRTASDVGLPDLDDATISRLNSAAGPLDYP
jgi:non-ribosomal peptide synthase protein (TIGR01720 family)